MNDLIKILELEEYHKPKPVCDGLFFRVLDSRYISPKYGTICVKREYRPLISKSCKGCAGCDWMMQDLVERNISFIDGGNHGDIVCLSITNESRDWETGLIDDWDLEFVVAPPLKNIK